MDVYFRLTTRRHPMQQRDVLLHHRHQNGVIGRLLSLTEWFDIVRMIVTSMIQTPHFHFVSLQYLTLLQLLQRLRRSMTGIHQFFSRNLRWLHPILYLIPPRQFEISCKSLQLSGSTRQHIQRHVKSRGIRVGWRQSDIRLRLGLIPVFCLQP